MKPVFQRIIGIDRGDCMSAAIASILELPYEDVPPWLAIAYDEGCMHNWHNYFSEWIAERGFHYLTIEFDDLNDWRQLVGAFCIASFKSQMFEGHTHAVVGSWKKEGDGHYFYVAHDPNPNNKPYDGIDPLRVSFLVPLNPSVNKSILPEQK